MSGSKAPKLAFINVCMYDVCMYVCIVYRYVCMYRCMFCIHTNLCYVSIYVWKYVRTYISLNVCMCMEMYVSADIGMYVCG